MRQEGIRPDVVVGHSVGEFAALASVGAMSDSDAIGLVRERGLAMAEAARQRENVEREQQERFEAMTREARTAQKKDRKSKKKGDCIVM